MTTLRVLVDDAPASDRACAWALFDDTGRVRERGYGEPAAWPRADRCEAVVAASCARVAALDLPPMPAARLQAAAAFAMEDQLAGPADNEQLLVLPPRAGGKVRVVVVGRSLLAGLRSFAGGGGHRFVRALPEVELPVPDGRWHWCIDEDGAAAFIRTPEGAGFPSAAPAGDGRLPDEIARLFPDEAGPPRALVIHAGTQVATIEHPPPATAIRIDYAGPWRWSDASAAAFAGAPDLLAEARPNPAGAPGRSRSRVLDWPLRIAAAGIALHVAATAAEWCWLRWDAYRDVAAFRALALQSGLASGEDGAVSRRSLAQRHAALRHANGLPGTADPLPLLARAAAPLARLPAGTLKGATFAAGAWTIELNPLDAGALRELDRGLATAGVPSLFATGAAGTRLRLGEP